MTRALRGGRPAYDDLLVEVRLFYHPARGHVFGGAAQLSAGVDPIAGFPPPPPAAPGTARSHVFVPVERPRHREQAATRLGGFLTLVGDGLCVFGGFGFNKVFGDKSCYSLTVIVVARWER
jgi:hypothetical protein